MDSIVRYSFHREYDKSLSHIPENDVLEKVNIRPVSDYVAAFGTKLIIDDTGFRDESLKILNCVKSFWSSINLQENSDGGYDMVIEDPKANGVLERKGIKDIPFRAFDTRGQAYRDGDYYQILCNRRLYIVLKHNEKTPDDVSIYDIRHIGAAEVRLAFRAHI